MRTFVNCIQTKCLYSVHKGPHGQPSCAIDCFLLCYHLKVSTEPQNGDAATIVKLLCVCSSATLDVALHTEGSLSPPVQDHTLQHLLEGAYRMFKLFRGSYAYITESKGLEGLKVQLSQFYDKVRTTSAALEAMKGLLYVGVPFPGMVSMATRRKLTWHHYVVQEIANSLQ